MTKGKQEVDETNVNPDGNTSETPDQSVEDSTGKVPEPSSEIPSEGSETPEIPEEPKKPLTLAEQARLDYELAMKHAEEARKLMEAIDEDPQITEFYNRIEIIKKKRSELQELFSELHNFSNELKTKYENDPAIVANILKGLTEISPTSQRTRQNHEASSEKASSYSVPAEKKKMAMPKAGQNQTDATLRYFELLDQNISPVKAITMIADEFIATIPKYAKMRDDEGYAHTVVHMARLVNQFKIAGLIKCSISQKQNELVGFYAERLPEYNEWLKTIQK